MFSCIHFHRYRALVITILFRKANESKEDGHFLIFLFHLFIFEKSLHVDCEVFAIKLELNVITIVSINKRLRKVEAC